MCGTQCSSYIFNFKFHKMVFPQNETSASGESASLCVFSMRWGDGEIISDFRCWFIFFCFFHLSSRTIHNNGSTFIHAFNELSWCARISTDIGPVAVGKKKRKRCAGATGRAKARWLAAKVCAMCISVVWQRAWCIALPMGQSLSRNNNYMLLLSKWRWWWWRWWCPVMFINVEIFPDSHMNDRWNNI